MGTIFKVLQCFLFLLQTVFPNLLKCSGEKSNKCSQCDYACYDKSALRSQLKTHSGDSPNKCNQCDYASVLEETFERTEREKANKCSQCNLFSGKPFEDTFENTQWRKVKQMQSMRLRILQGRPFEVTYENAQWRKIKQMQPMGICIF